MKRFWILAALLVCVPTWGCGDGDSGETTPTDETYTTGAEELDQDDPPEPQEDDPL